jgi:hypothetical protein
VIAAQEDVRNAEPAVDAWSREVGVVESAAVRVAVFDGRAIVAKHAGNKSRRGFDHDECAEFTASEDVVANGEAFEVEQGESSIVKALVASA